jgi:hypothetical protein
MWDNLDRKVLAQFPLTALQNARYLDNVVLEE